MITIYDEDIVVDECKNVLDIDDAKNVEQAYIDGDIDDAKNCVCECE